MTAWSPALGEQIVAYALGQLGVPYRYGGETPKGEPDAGFDCSGLFQWAAARAGVAIPRTTTEQWDALVPVRAGEELPGDGVYFDVPSDGGEAPQHAGIVTGPGQMVEAPHTGADVKTSPIPNGPGESLMGYRRVAAAAPPSPQPTPPAPPAPSPQEAPQMWCTDPESGQILLTDAEGNFYAPVGIPDMGVGTLAEHPSWGAGDSANPCVGITPWKDPTGAWGYAYITAPAGGKGGAGPWDLYHFTRAGQPS